MASNTLYVVLDACGLVHQSLCWVYLWHVEVDVGLAEKVIITVLGSQEPLQVKTCKPTWTKGGLAQMNCDTVCDMQQ